MGGRVKPSRQFGSVKKTRIAGLSILLIFALLAAAMVLLAACSATQLLTEVQTRVQALNTKVYVVGDTGPAGGTVFYDKGVYSNGWRYLEVAPYDQNAGATTVWGSSGSAVGTTNSAIGTGKPNTDMIVAAVGTPLNTYAAGLCASLTLNGFSDWFLPSSGELEQLKSTQIVGAGAAVGTETYWSSTEMDYSYAYKVDMALVGTTSTDIKSSGYKVRAIRQF